MLISNPFASYLLLPLFSVFSALLGCGLLGVTVARNFVADRALKKQLLLRWATWSVIAPVTVIALLSGPLTFALLSSVLSLVSTAEFCKITARSKSDSIILLCLSVLLPVVALWHFSFMPVCLFAAAATLVFVALCRNQALEQIALSVLGLMYVPLLASYAVALYGTGGPAILISVISASALANVIAFVFGKILGGPKLAPQVSPNKTWWGVLGSTVGSYLGFYLLSNACKLSLPPAIFVGIPLVVAVFGVIGDLFESQIKRSFHTKDAGTWLPGFGGALDRVDGLLFILPAVYYLIAVLNGGAL